MTRSIRGIARLRELLAVLAMLPDGGGEAGRWFAGVMAEYEADARRGSRFDEICGLIPPRGVEAWWAIELRQRRNELLRLAALRWYAREPSRHRQAAAIARDLARYETSRWRRDKLFAVLTDRARGSRREAFFLILKCGPAPSARTVERALPCLAASAGKGEEPGCDA